MDKEKSGGLGLLIGADGLRAIACLLVIAHHLFQRLTMQAQTKDMKEVQAFFLMGSAGVSIFFVLSGFLLSYPFWKRYLDGSDFPSMKQYVVRRAARIIPGYYIALIAAFIAIKALNMPSEHTGIRFLAGFTFTAGFHYITFFPAEPNGALWSIGFEVFSYILMPLFMFGLFKMFNAKRTLLKSLIYWAAVLFVIFYINKLIHKYLTPDDVNRGWQYGIVGGAKYWMPNYNPVGFFGHFSMGIIAAGLTTKLFKIQNITNKIAKTGVFDIIAVLSLVGAFYILWEYRYAPEFSHSLQKQPYFFPYFTILIAVALAVLTHTKIFGKVLDNPLFRFTSKVSFGLYVWHYFIVILVSNVWAKDYQYMGVSNLQRWSRISLLIVASSYIIATLSFYLIEKPILNWAHKKLKGKTVKRTSAYSGR